MVRQDEEDRARAFREQEERFARLRQARNEALRGDAGAAKAVRDGWEPVVLARLEAATGYERDDEE